MIELLKTTDVVSREKCASLLRSLAEQAETGEIIEFAGVVYYPAGKYECVASCGRSRHATAGALLDAAISRLND